MTAAKRTKLNTNGEKKFVMKHVFNNVWALKEEKERKGPVECHFKTNWSCSVCWTVDGELAIYLDLQKSGKDAKISTEIDAKIYKNVGTKWLWKEVEFSASKWRKTIFKIPSEEAENYLIDGSLTVEFHVSILEMTGIEVLPNSLSKSHVALKLLDDSENSDISLGSDTDGYPSDDSDKMSDESESWKPEGSENFEDSDDTDMESMDMSKDSDERSIISSINDDDDVKDSGDFDDSEDSHGKDFELESGKRKNRRNITDTLDSDSGELGSNENDGKMDNTGDSDDDEFFEKLERDIRKLVKKSGRSCRVIIIGEKK